MCPYYLLSLQFIKFLKRVLGCSLSDMSLGAQVPLMIIAYFSKNFLLLYPLSVFMLLTWESCYKVRAMRPFTYWIIALIVWLEQ